MSRHALSILTLALVVALPLHASASSKAKLVAVRTSLPLSSPMASSKGARLVANSILPGGVVAPKKVAAKPAAKPAVVVAAVTKPAVPVIPGRLARLTAYWTQEDPWTAKHESSTGIRLHEGHCAVDPKLIPYGSVVQIPGMGSYVAVDTGSAVISRQAALGSGQNAAERAALVVDLFFENRKDAEEFAAHGPAYVSVSWTPRSLAYADSASNPRALPAIPTMPAGTVYVLAQAPTMADMRMPLAFRAPQL
jgi:hypothetical protein